MVLIVHTTSSTPPSKMTKYPAQGGCVCERVRYELSEEPKATWLCHCLSCRKCTGSLFMANSYVKSSTFKITKGKEELQTFEDYNTSSGLPLRLFFCRVCSGFIYTDSEEMQKDGCFVIPSGTLDDPIDWKPSMEFWCIRRSPWLPSFGTSEGKMFDKNPS